MAATPKPKKTKAQRERSAISKAYEAHHKGPKYPKGHVGKKLPPGEFEKRLAKAKRDD